MRLRIVPSEHSINVGIQTIRITRRDDRRRNKATAVSSVQIDKMSKTEVVTANPKSRPFCSEFAAKKVTIAVKATWVTQASAVTIENMREEPSTRPNAMMPPAK